MEGGVQVAIPVPIRNGTGKDKVTPFLWVEVDERADPHPTLAFWAYKGVYLIYFLNEPCPVSEVLFR